MPLQGSDTQRMARRLTNAALAQRLSMIRDKRRSFDKETTEAILEEAERRLRWHTPEENPDA